MLDIIHSLISLWNNNKLKSFQCLIPETAVSSFNINELSLALQLEYDYHVVVMLPSSQSDSIDKEYVADDVMIISEESIDSVISKNYELFNKQGKRLIVVSDKLFISNHNPDSTNNIEIKRLRNTLEYYNISLIAISNISDTRLIHNSI